MINPVNLQTIEYKSDKVTIVDIKNIPQFDKEDYDLFDKKDYNSFIIDVKRSVRNSFEYQTMVEFLRDKVGMNHCSVYENVNNIESKKIKIHLHHSPFTIEDIIRIVSCKRMANVESMYVEDVAKEVMYLHYKLLVGLIPLSETPHELVHNKILFIPIDKVYGKVDQFYRMYYDYIEPDLKEAYENIKQFSEYVGDTIYNKNILDINYTFLDLSEVFGEVNYNDIADLMSQRIKEIKNNPAMQPQQELQPLVRFNKPINN